MSLNDIRKALDEAGGNKEKALEILRTRGATIAEKKSSRSTQEGIIEAYVHSTKKIAVLVEMLCETDFVARNPLFSELAHELALHIAAMDPADVEALMDQPFIKDQTVAVRDVVTGYVAKLGENIKVGTFTRLQI
ncbi:MAG: hypothetical protein A3A33_04585 [Candidatus Yanofskybacteria bacterium RIFCSPLOWO2_01_FULL_49_25]|uniref:Elongation factor Ts n=1 Tax=Candidatus Yanofskybacteria bacterium RIFCSPLOWO2_01_FULL_49_25 TaxID=1802701 RepID=A0A1F8GR53_9BACT|nr:MAG: hypothetical protein A3A33_04585 [Candidatus Yanofskybacteria bacterium RIFCSPLOWO2_01_FULL_49_25]